MKRPDLVAEAERLGLNLDGWQVLDATPQERSAGLFQLGPAPLTAIKRGFSLEYDTDFVIGEVNADILDYWQRTNSTQFDLGRRNTNHVGKLISTKSVSSNRRTDVTLEYKFAEGTAEEREALARRPSVHLRSLPSPNELLFNVSYPTRVKAGDTIIVTINATNCTASAASACLNSLYRAIQYTGVPVARIGHSVKDLQIGGGQSAQFSIEIPAEQYIQHLAHAVNTIKFTNSAKVSNTGQTWAEECIVLICGGDALEISAPNSVDLGEHGHVEVQVINSFGFALTDVIVRASGEGILDPTEIKLGTIGAGERVSTSIEIDPFDVGDHVIAVTLDSHELKDISKSVCIGVTNNSGMPRWESFVCTLKRRNDPSWDELFSRV
eukprot:TRINITY_DN948_c0_g1_i1.p1 TRINITY_DN948_c0_g1~~TRINITY_DN948_c0_g1_i1.p1  ORF type:complete len:381 (+),score=64.88 TRINITY_DN948_c0_g1_i1:377-1519(+)